MKRKINILLIVFTIALVFCSCSIKQNSSEGSLNNNANSIESQKKTSGSLQDLDSNKTAINPEASPSNQTIKPSNNSVPGLKEDDFGVVFSNALVKVTDNPDKMIELWGRGKVKNDDEAFIGTDPSAKYRRYEYYYIKENSGIKAHVRRGEIDYIYFMDITDWYTNRGIKKGDSYNKMVEAYGKPTKESIEDSELVCEYPLKNVSLMFKFDKDKNISNITIWNYLN
ncbi:MAG TPA: hypothetical protein PLG49_04340 [Defluviitaleaceae bacterium]|nr:hypothetical protein [Defluviitaleaceae bacterium]